MNSFSKGIIICPILTEINFGVLNILFLDLLDKLANISGITTAQLFELHAIQILKPIPSTVSIWTEQYAFKNIFSAFVQGSGMLLLLICVLNS